MKNMYVFFLTNFKLAGESEIPSEHNSLLKYVAGNMRIKCEINKIVLKPSIKWLFKLYLMLLHKNGYEAKLHCVWLTT